MACFRPISGYRRADGTVAFSRELRGDVGTIEVPCGQCVGCRLERSRQWAMRCVHESKLHRESSFVTLTYDDKNLPPGSSLRYRDFQLFMKRLRKSASDIPIRFYMCGEYGESTQRPHYHALLFGVDFPDKKRFRKAVDDGYLYTSSVLERLWPHGNSLIGEVTFNSAAYVARYCMKKVTGDHATEYYKSVDLSTGEVFDRVPEFNKMSLKPGIGAGFMDKYFFDIYPHGSIAVNGKMVRPPKYYDKRFDESGFTTLDGRDYEALQFSRELLSRDRAGDNTVDRLLVREKVALARSNLFKRSLE